MSSILNDKLEKLKKEVNEFKKKNDEHKEKVKKITDETIKIIADIIKKGPDKSEIEVIERGYYDLVSSQYDASSHMEFGNQIQSNIRNLLTEIFGNIVGKHAQNNVGDVIIEKNGKKAVVEVKSFIDRGESSPQGIKKLEEIKNEVEKDKKTKYVVYAHYHGCYKRYPEFHSQVIKNNWIILMSHQTLENGELEYHPIFDIEKGYYSLLKLVEVIRKHID